MITTTWMVYLAFALVLFVFRRTRWGRTIYDIFSWLASSAVVIYSGALLLSICVFTIYLTDGDWANFSKYIHGIFFAASVAVLVIWAFLIAVSLFWIWLIRWYLFPAREPSAKASSISKKNPPQKGGFFRDAFKKLESTPIRYRDVYTGLCAYCGAGKQHDGQCSNCGAGWKEEVYREPEGI